MVSNQQLSSHFFEDCPLSGLTKESHILQTYHSAWQWAVQMYGFEAEKELEGQMKRHCSQERESLGNGRRVGDNVALSQCVSCSTLSGETCLHFLKSSLFLFFFRPYLTIPAGVSVQFHSWKQQVDGSNGACGSSG